MNIGARVKELRTKKNMSMEELARKAGYKSASMIKSIEDGTRTPSFNKNLDLARALGVDVNELVGNKKLSKNEKIILGAISSYVDELPEKDIELGVKVFRLIYDAYLGREAKKELVKITDKLSLEAHKEAFPYLGEIEESEDITFLNESAVLNMRKRICKIRILVYKEFLSEVYFDDVLFSREEGDRWDTPERVSVTLMNNIFEMIPEMDDFDVIEIETNNEYLRKGIESWVDSWAKSGWKKASGDKISFKAFWEKVYNLKKSKEVVVYGKRT